MAQSEKLPTDSELAMDQEVDVESPVGAPQTSDEDSLRFMTEFTRHQHSVHVYVRALVPNKSDADDVMQEVSLTLWSKWHTFKPGTDFRRWACGVAYFEVLRYRRKAAKGRLWFSESLIDVLSSDYQKNSSELSARLDALSSCVGKLSDRDRQLINARYRGGVSVSELAETYRKPQSTIYKMLLRIREALRRCTDHALEAELHPSRPLHPSSSLGR